MSEESESLNEEDRSVFRPFTRESIAAIEARIAEENAKKKELQKKKEEGEVRTKTNNKNINKFNYNDRIT